MSGLIGPSGVPLGRQPVVAHIITVPPGITPQGIRNLITYWQQTLGVPAVVMAEGARLVGAVLADGELVELPADDGLTVKVQALLDGRTAEPTTVRPPGPWGTARAARVAEDDRDGGP